ncbi:hypothetical protein L3X38_029023 [Prunus dulcis]|uniref:C3H1-type domain-containing protein n=1 Tax=Prunus dulcis TaxID=3755 RepID=A0AAD4VTB4_PRUDU|nr:hypothetical protein L3X38_029023 [Prunus dulcis]
MLPAAAVAARLLLPVSVSNCKFNHPRTTTKNNQDHFWSGGRKDGRDGSFNPRSREPFAAPFVENFMGLPIRPGERDCTYYMRNLSCRYGLSCRFNHPDPTPAGESDPPSGYGNGGPASLQGASSSTAARWSAPRSQGIPSRNTEHNGYQQQQVEELPQRPGQPVCIYFSTTGDCEFKSNCKYHHPKNQTAVSPSCALNDKGLPLRPQQQVEELPQRPGQPVCIYFSTTGDCEFKSNCKYHHPKNQTAVSPSCALNDKGLPLRPQQQVEELPQRPGQPVCIYFSTTGDCEFKSNCKYHHPKNQTAVSPSCALNDKGLPLRPGQNICTQYSTYGNCNSGPACKFDHPSL